MQLTKDNLLASLPESDNELRLKFGCIRRGDFLDFVTIPRMQLRFDTLMASLMKKGKVIKSGGYWMKPSDKPGTLKPQIGVHRMTAEQLLQSFQSTSDDGVFHGQ